MYTPYTYYIKWTALDKHYYGVRYAKNCNPSDFWITYFTSSKKVKKLRESFGEPDVIQIRKTFANSNDAIEWEYKVLKRLKVDINDRWLNQTTERCFPHFKGENHHHYGRRWTLDENSKRNMSNAHQGLNWWNNGIVTVFSKEQPDNTFVIGRLTFNNVGAKMGAEANSNKYWVHNNEREMMILKESEIPEGYVKGRLRNRWSNKHTKGTSWWNNGIVTKMSKECPGKEWTKGRLKNISKV